MLDVRRADEYEGAAIAGAVNIPIHELPRRAQTQPIVRLFEARLDPHRSDASREAVEQAGHRYLAAYDISELEI